MTDKTYNGWTNFATWRIFVDFAFADYSLDDFGFTPNGDSREDDVDRLQNFLHEMVANTIDEECNSFVADYAMIFIRDVNFEEIAEHMIEDYAEQTDAYRVD